MVPVANYIYIHNILSYNHAVYNIFFSNVEVPKRSCKEIYDDDNTTITGLYKTAPTDNKGEFTVFCDMTTSGGGWTVIQRRENNATDFYRGWQEYKTGFGKLDGNFWLGLEKIHRITQIENHELLVTMVHPDGKTFTSKYDLFKVDSAATDYQLDLGEFIKADKHDGGNSFSYHDNQKFSTFDRDNDKSLENCAEKHHGAWWYKSCHEVNLNGRYYDGNYGNYNDGNDPLAVRDGIVWVTNTGWWHSLKSVTMAIRSRS